MTRPPPDPRITPWRADLAAVELVGVITAPRYVEGADYQVIAAATPLRCAPAADATLASELLHGDIFRVYERRNDWAWGQAVSDNYVGYVAISALTEQHTPATHHVGALASLVFPAPDLKTPPRETLGLTARVTVRQERHGFAEIGDDRWLYARHLAPLDQRESDISATARRFLHTPYLWGGRTARGIACSGLVQIALQCAGVAAPRDSDMQAESVGTLIAQDMTGIVLQRNDLVFFPGHVGIMSDDTHLIHANAHHMMVVEEPLRDVIERLAAEHPRAVTAIRRLPAQQRT